MKKTLWLRPTLSLKKEVRMEYKGYTYDPWEDVEPNECLKTFHDVRCPDGTRTHMHVSPYGYVSTELFEAWIDAGLPARRAAPNAHKKFDNDCVELLRGMA